MFGHIGNQSVAISDPVLENVLCPYWKNFAEKRESFYGFRQCRAIIFLLGFTLKEGCVEFKTL